MLCCFEVDCVLDMMLTLCMIECMFYIVGTMLVAPIAARLRPGAGGRYNAGRRVTVDNGLHRHELDLHNMRRKVKRKIIRMRDLLRARYPTLTVGELMEVIWDNLRPLMIADSFFVLWRGQNTFRDNDVLHGQVLIAMTAANTTFAEMWEWQGLYIRTALTARGHVIIRR